MLMGEWLVSREAIISKVPWALSQVLCMCMCVSMYQHVCIKVLCEHVHACPYVCAYVCLCMSVCMSAFNRFPLCSWACVNVCVHTSVSVFSRSPVCAHAHVCLCVCMHERVRAHSRTLALVHLHFSRPVYPAWDGITGHGLGMFSMSLANAQATLIHTQAPIYIPTTGHLGLHNALPVFAYL